MTTPDWQNVPGRRRALSAHVANAKAVRKAIAAGLGGGLTALAACLPDGVTAGEWATILAALLGSAVATWWAPPNVPTYTDTPTQDT